MAISLLVMWFISSWILLFITYCTVHLFRTQIKNSSWRNFLAHECTHEYFYNRYSCLFRLGFMKIMLQLLMHLAVVCLTVLLFICDMSLLFNWSPMFQWLQLPYWQKNWKFRIYFQIFNLSLNFEFISEKMQFQFFVNVILYEDTIKRIWPIYRTDKMWNHSKTLSVHIWNKSLHSPSTNNFS